MRYRCRARRCQWGFEVNLRITVEVKAYPEDTCPDIESGEHDFESIEEGWECARKVEAQTNARYESRGEPARARVVSVEPMEF